MQRLLLFMLCCGLGFSLNAQVILEDFEGGVADLPWNAFEGTYGGPVMNPEDTTGINPSEWAGSYTKAGDRGFSFFVAQLDEPLDLSINNQYSIQIYAGAATQLLLKLEGSDGDATQAIESTVNIATPNVWRTYTFDFSAASELDSLTDIILFFDPGVETSADTYLFDNLIASPAGVCAGVMPIDTIIDDFECQRNATYGVPGFNDIEVIANPDPSGINTSDSVAQYTDREGGFHALVIDYNSALDLSENNQVCIDVWAPVSGDLLFKLQGGVSPAFEEPVAVNDTMQWVEVCMDFSSQSAANHEQLVFFFNAGENGEGDIYFLDNITRTPAPPAEALEDFEDGANLGWMPLNDNNDLHGTFNGAIANPDMTGNESSMVGSYTRGNSMFSTLTALLPNGIDLSGNPQLNLDVWAPDGATSVTLQLQSATEGAKSAEANLDATMTWQTLSFNFEEFEDVTDFERINILFDPETAGNGLYYFDNLVQGQSTVDACADVETNEDILDNFECQRNSTYTVGAGDLTAVSNPDVTPENPSSTVGQFIDPPGAFNALVIDNVEPFDLSQKNQLAAKIWSPVDGQILFKLEGGANPALEIFQDIPATMEWVDYSVDFSAAADMGFTRLVLFFGAGDDNAEANTYFIDDIELNRAPFVSDCVVTFETVDLTIDDWRYFANGALNDNDFIISENPDTTGINPSPFVGTFEEAADGEPFAGAFADPSAPVALPNDNKVVTMKVWMEVAGQVVLKLEQGQDGAASSGDVFADYTTAGEWQELTFDMSVLPDDARYNRITIIPNFGVVPESPLTHYFDDIAVGGGDCALVDNVFNPVVLDELRVFPNPTTDQLTIENPNGATTFTLTNLLGQRMKQLNVLPGAGPRVSWNITELPRATYVLTAQNSSGRLVARSLIVKE